MSLLTKYKPCLFLLITLCFFTPKAQADSTSIIYNRLEVLMNVTNSISRFTGNGINQTIFEDPFLFGLKLSNKNKTHAIRLGVNFNVNRSTEDLNGTSKISTLNSWAPLVGYEWRRKLSPKFEFYGGLDARYYYDINETNTTNFFSSLNISTIFNNTQKGWGVGPFCGFVYNFSPRISILTEANFYVNFINIQRKFSNDGGENYTYFENRNLTSISPTAPSSIFLLIRL